MHTGTRAGPVALVGLSVQHYMLSYSEDLDIKVPVMTFLSDGCVPASQAPQHMKGFSSPFSEFSKTSKVLSSWCSSLQLPHLLSAVGIGCYCVSLI